LDSTLFFVVVVVVVDDDDDADPITKPAPYSGYDKILPATVSS
jgi:hypothetical protein